jgi:Holliday junction resolvase
MRVRARKDNNHTDIVGTLRACGWSVLDTAQLGKGAPDLFVSKAKRTIAIEIKDGKKPPSARKLTKDEKIFKDTWQGEYMIIESVEDVIKI